MPKRANKDRRFGAGLNSNPCIFGSVLFGRVHEDSLRGGFFFRPRTKRNNLRRSRIAAGIQLGSRVAISEKSAFNATEFTVNIISHIILPISHPAIRDDLQGNMPQMRQTDNVTSSLVWGYQEA